MECHSRPKAKGEMMEILLGILLIYPTIVNVTVSYFPDVLDEDSDCNLAAVSPTCLSDGP
jgi:hypothetical protein